MELKVNREMIPVTESILDELQEQSVELDYVLPDYHPDIFRIIGCSCTPTICSYSISAERMTYEMEAEIRVLYCGAESNQVQCICRKWNVSKTIDLPRSCENPIVHIQPKTDYVNCRAVNPRRLEVRGAISVKIKLTGERKQEVICDIFGLHTQLRKCTVSYAAQKRHVTKNIVLNEEMELGSAKPDILQIVRCDARVQPGEQSILAGKLIVKGEVAVRVLYTCESDGAPGMEAIQFPIPYSQIVDMEQIDDSFHGMAQIQVVRCNCKPVTGKDGTLHTLQCETELRLICTAVQSATTQLVTDAFSTLHPCAYTTIPLQIDQAPIPVQSAFVCKTTVPGGDSKVEYVYDLQCRVKNVNTTLPPQSGSIRISGMLCCRLLVRDENGSPMLLEKEEAFENQVSADAVAEAARFHGDVRPADCTYHLSADGSVSVTANLQLDGQLFPSAQHTCLSQLEIDESKKLIRDGDYALKLYYGVEQEAIWDIAKRYSTSVQAIMEENDLTEERLTEPGMLLIPIVC